MKRKTIVLFVVFSFVLFPFVMGCASSSTNNTEDPLYENIPTLDDYDAIFDDSIYDDDWPFSEGSGYSGHSPYITQFVTGIRLSDSENGLPEKTVFKVGDEFWYGFHAMDSIGDWKRMVHTLTQGNFSFDMSWDFPNDFLGRQSLRINDVYKLGVSGTWEMTWYIVDNADNKSNVITKTIMVH